MKANDVRVNYDSSISTTADNPETESEAVILTVNFPLA